MTPHVFYLHGFASSSHSTKAAWLAERFLSVGIVMRCPDLNVPGFETLTVTRMLDEVDRLIAGVPEAPVVLFGSSLGGLVAYYAAVRNRRVERPVLLAPALDSVTSGKAVQPRRARSSRSSFVLRVFFVIFVCFVAGRFPASLAAVHAQEPTDAALEIASAGRTMRVHLAGGNRRIVDLPIESYVARVLAGEGEPGAAEAAQEALAIAIRTFTIANAGRHRREGFDLCTTTHCQIIRAATPASRRAALATTGQVLMHDGSTADVFYSASCGGRSEAASAVWPGAPDHPYLRSVPDDVCAGDAAWTLDVTASRVEQVLRKAGFAGRRLSDLRIERRSSSGRVASLHLSGLHPEVIAGDDFRAAIGARELRSTAFSVRKMGDRYRFTGRGYGHGVGLCVIGAGRRAARGESAVDILERYYPGLQLAMLSANRAAPSARGREAPAVAASTPTHAEPSIVTRVPASAGVSTGEIDRLARRALHELSRALGTGSRSITLEMYDSLDAFRQTTGRPWWDSVVVDGSVIELAPLAVLTQRDGLEAAIRRGVAELLVTEALSNGPRWVRVGAARYFARPADAQRRRVSSGLRCPSDAEIVLAVSASAQREAELRAESCFARALATSGDWRKVK
jgi:stage II sporulation protein D